MTDPDPAAVEAAQIAVQILVKPILDLIYADSHQWSSRPCGTCRAITALAGQSFGCDRYRQEKRP